jgi:TonB family protein
MSKERKDKHFLHKPQIEGGSTAIKKLVTENLQYPKEALEARVEGTVHLRYEINHKGIVTSARIISGIGYGCDEEAIRLVKLLQFQIAKNRGLRAIFHKTISIHFKLPKEAPVSKSPTPPPTTIQYHYSTQTPSKDDTSEGANPVTDKGKTKTSYTYTIQLKQ